MAVITNGYEPFTAVSTHCSIILFSSAMAFYLVQPCKSNVGTLDWLCRGVSTEDLVVLFKILHLADLDYEIGPPHPAANASSWQRIKVDRFFFNTLPASLIIQFWCFVSFKSLLAWAAPPREALRRSWNAAFCNPQRSWCACPV